MKLELTKSLEDYIEAIYIIRLKKNEVRVKDLMDYFNYKVSSVNQAIKQLVQKELVLHQKYGGIILTEEGEKIAKDIYKKHTTLVEFLTKILSIDKEIADYDACSFEHYIHYKTLNEFFNLIDFFNKNKDCLEKFKDFKKRGKNE